jgi:multidrug resistance efflux pump
MSQQSTSQQSTDNRAPSRSLVRRTAMGLIWAAAGGGALLYAGALVYANLVRLEVDAATIAGTIEPIRAPADGVLFGFNLRAGETVAAGSRLAVVQDPEIEREVALARTRLDRARSERDLRQAELAAERAKRDDTVVVATAELKVVQAEVASLEEQVAIAITRVDRFTGLHAQGFAARQRLEDMANYRASLTAQLARARLVEGERRALFVSAQAGRFFDGIRVTGRLAEAEAAVQRAREEIDLAVDELQAWQQRRAASVVRAADAGRIIRVLRSDGSAVRAGDTLAVFERAGERVVHAFLTQKEIMRVAVGDTANIYLTALHLRTTAQVVTIERAAGFLDDIESRYTWRQARDNGVRQSDLDRTARVVLRLAVDDGERLRTVIEPGMPVVVSFARRSTDTVLGDFRVLDSAPAVVVGENRP